MPANRIDRSASKNAIQPASHR